MKSIVIGSGFGGIAAALRLKAKNHNVTLIEKQPDLGGRARVFKKNGFTFDAGPTVITAPYLIEELFQLFDKKPEDYIKLTPLKIWYRFIYEDGGQFDYSGDEEEMKKQIKEINEDDVKGYEELVKFTKKILPGQRLELDTKIINFKRGIANCEGSGKVDDQLACKAEFNLILPEEIKKYNLDK